MNKEAASGVQERRSSCNKREFRRVWCPVLAASFPGTTSREIWWTLSSPVLIFELSSEIWLVIACIGTMYLLLSLGAGAGAGAGQKYYPEHKTSL